MKEIALIGDSNALMKTGYGQKLIDYYGDQCDRFALGGSTSLFAIYCILKYNIIGSYKYVIIDSSIIETGGITVPFLNTNVIITNLLYIIKSFYNSNTQLIFLQSVRRDVEVYNSVSYIYSGLQRIFNFKLLNMVKEFSYTTYFDKKGDPAHLLGPYQDIIFRRILDILPITYELNKVKLEDIQFSIKNCTEILPKSSPLLKGTSILQLPVIELTPDITISLPENLYLCGIFYYAEGGYAYLNIANAAQNFVTRLNINKVYTGAFWSSYLGYSIVNGLKGGLLSIVYNRKGKLVEISWPDSSGSLTQCKDKGRIYLESLIFCNLNPNYIGNSFYKTHQKFFTEAQNDLVTHHCLYRSLLLEDTKEKINNILENGSNLVDLIFNKKVDLYPLLSDYKNIIPNIIIWAWKNVDNLDFLSTWKTPLLNCLKRLNSIPAFTQDCHLPINPAFTLLHFFLWSISNDLQKYNIYTLDGQHDFLNWNRVHPSALTI